MNLKWFKASKKNNHTNSQTNLSSLSWDLKILNRLKSQAIYQLTFADNNEMEETRWHFINKLLPMYK